MSLELQDLQDNIDSWARDKFGEKNSLESILAHLKEEVEDLIKNPYDPENWADVFILYLNGAARAGYDVSDIILATDSKHLINLSRQWENPDGNGIIRRKK